MDNSYNGFIGSACIDSEEYRTLVKRSAYLDVILKVAGGPSYVLADVVNCIKAIEEGDDKPQKEEGDGDA